MADKRQSVCSKEIVHLLFCAVQLLCSQKGVLSYCYAINTLDSPAMAHLAGGGLHQHGNLQNTHSSARLHTELIIFPLRRDEFTIFVTSGRSYDVYQRRKLRHLRLDD